jgi:hypothetical protein
VGQKQACPNPWLTNFIYPQSTTVPQTVPVISVQPCSISPKIYRGGEGGGERRKREGGGRGGGSR